jgi:carboxymethylenebutenolidase
MLNRTTLQIPSTDCQIDCYLVQPESPNAAIIVIHEVFGVNDWLKSVCDRLAMEGYAAIAPNMVQRTAAGLNLDYSDESLALGRSHKDLMTAEQIAADYRAVISSLRSQGFQNIGNIGFCFGGHIAFLGAMQPEIAMTAVFYGSGISALTPGGGEASMTRSFEIRGSVDLYYGTQDALIPNEQADRVVANLMQAGVKHRVFRYPVGHGFFCEVRSIAFDAMAATEAWEHVKEGFAIAFGAGSAAFGDFTRSRVPSLD